MTNTEVKNAMLTRLPVECKGITYSRISAIIYRPDDLGGVSVSLELLDKSGHSVTITHQKDVTLSDKSN